MNLVSFFLLLKKKNFASPSMLQILNLVLAKRQLLGLVTLTIYTNDNNDTTKVKIT